MEFFSHITVCIYTLKAVLILYLINANQPNLISLKLNNLQINDK